MLLCVQNHHICVFYQISIFCTDFRTIPGTERRMPRGVAVVLPFYQISTRPHDLSRWPLLVIGAFATPESDIGVLAP